MVFESEFSIYQKITIAGDIQAIVTSIQFLAKNYVLIKCEWISAGNLNFAWFDEEQLKEFMKGKNLGE